MSTSTFLTGTRKLFQYYKTLGEKAIAQVDDSQIDWRPNEASNSIAIIVHHPHWKHALPVYGFAHDRWRKTLAQPRG